MTSPNTTADWQSEAMHQNRLLHDALTRAEVAEARLAKALSMLASIGNTQTSGGGQASVMAFHAREALAEIEGETTPTCRRCEVPMAHGIATGQTYVGGVLDFEGDKHSSTFSVGGSGKVINVWKCPDCGSSISKGDGK